MTDRTRHEPARSPDREVVVTGMGVVTPIGVGVEAFWDGLCAGRSGVGPITGWDASMLPTQIAAEVRDFDPTVVIPAHHSRRLAPFAQFAVVAAAEAAESAKLTVEESSAHRVGVTVGSAYGPTSLTQTATLTLERRGPRRIPAFFPTSGAMDSASGEVAMHLGARGPSACVSTACATSATAIGDALRMIRHGYADVVVAGGSDDMITPLDMASASNARALSRRNDEPQRASRPFDRDRDGFVVGAGAGIVVLEAREHAEARGAPMLAELAGYGASTDLHHHTAPDPDGLGARLAMRAALDDAGVPPEAIDYVNAHGTGTRLNDEIEAAAIRATLGAHATRIPISSVKSMTGHMIGAAGAVELIACVRAIADGVVPPTVNCDHPEDPDLDFVPHTARPHTTRTALSNSFGFAGHNGALVVREVAA